jgi:hypothetical protein
MRAREYDNENVRESTDDRNNRHEIDSRRRWSDDETSLCE